jgi:hypothetical protein
MLGKHNISESEKDKLRSDELQTVKTNCTTCHQPLLLSKHPVAPNMIFIEETV